MSLLYALLAVAFACGGIVRPNERASCDTWAVGMIICSVIERTSKQRNRE